MKMSGHALQLLRNHLGVADLERVVAVRSTQYTNRPIQAFELFTEDNPREIFIHVDNLHSQDKVRTAFIRAGLPAFGIFTKKEWIDIVQAIQAAVSSVREDNIG